MDIKEPIKNAKQLEEKPGIGKSTLLLQISMKLLKL